MCAAELCAFREKDRAFVAALLEAGVVDPAIRWERLGAVPEEHRTNADVAGKWLGARR